MHGKNEIVDLLHLNCGIHTSWHNWGIIEETEWPTSGCCSLEANETCLTPACSPAVFDLPEIGTVSCCQHCMVQAACGAHTGQNSAAVALELAVSVHHHSDSTAAKGG